MRLRVSPSVTKKPPVNNEDNSKSSSTQASAKASASRQGDNVDSGKAIDFSLPSRPQATVNTRVALHNPESMPAMSAGVEDRLSTMGKAVDDASKLFKYREDVSGEKKQNLFVAQEYYFAGVALPGTTLQTWDRQLDQDQKREVVEGMKQVSRDHPGITIMPGTITWKKEINRSEQLDSYLERHNAKTGPLKEHYTEKYMNKNKGMEVPNNDQNNPHSRLNKVDATIAKANALLGVNVLKTPDESTTHVVHNTAYSYRDGEVINKQHKVFDANEVLVSEGENRIHGPDASPTVYTMPNGERVTCEICVDHDADLAHLIARDSRGENLPGEIHVIESAYVVEKNSLPISHYSEVLVHASTRRKADKSGPYENIHGVKVFDKDTKQKFEVPPLVGTEYITVYEP